MDYVTEYDKNGNAVQVPVITPAPQVAPVDPKTALNMYLQKMMSKDPNVAGMAAAQDQAAQGATGLGIAQAGETIGRALSGAAPAQGSFDTYRQANQQRLNDYLAQVKEQRDRDAQGLTAAKMQVDMAQSEAAGAAAKLEKDRLQKNADREYNLKLKDQANKPAPQTVFEKTTEANQAKNYAKIQDNAGAAAANEEAVNQAYDMFEKYSAGKVGGTGGISTLGGLTKYVSEPTEQLDTKFKDLALSKMVNMFQGMSKAVDSNTERRAFESTTPSITLDDKSNRERLIGLKAIAQRNKLEAEAQKNWVESAEGKGTLEGYVSPNKNLSSAVDKAGNVVLVPKGEKLPQGLMKIDEYVNSFGKAKGKSPAPKRTRADIQAEMAAIDKQLED